MPVSAGELVIERMRKGYPPIKAQPVMAGDSLSTGVRQLEARLGAQQVTFQRLRTTEWEARTYWGKVGRGISLADAVYDLLDSL